MARRKSNSKNTKASRRKRSRSILHWPRKFLPSARQRRAWWLAFRRAPVGAQLVIAFVATFTVWLTANFVYQVVRKPSELFFPVSGTLYKTPTETWERYASIFEKHSTSVMTPELLAAIAQVEGSGNPIVRTYWRWRFTSEPFEVYRPASSAVGMYQITDGTYDQSRRYCIHDHEVVEDGPWNAFRSCWFNSTYMRVIPSHAVEMTSAYLDRNIANIVSQAKVSATLTQKQNLAAIIHLCGAGEGGRFARRGFRLSAGQRCGDHEVRLYLSRVMSMKNTFITLRDKQR
jgi:hypothetical protein